VTLQQFFDLLSQNTSIILFYFIALPLTACLSLVFGKGQGKDSPWKELYSVLVYLSCIPGIFAVTLNVYLFLFERRSIMDTNIFTQILPIVCMFVTLWFIRSNIRFEDIPGFGRIGGLVMLITILFAAMWVLEKTHIFVISVMPFHYFIVLLIVLIVGARYGWKALYAGPKNTD